MRPALLFALAGTSDAGAAGALRNVERLARERFAGVAVRWAYTSRGVRAKLAARGRPADDPAAALARLCADGFGRVAVQSLHMVQGMEYGELRAAVASSADPPGGLERVALGRPMLEEPGLFPDMVAALLREDPPPEGEGAALLLVAHGSREPAARAAYERAGAWCRRPGRRVLLGTLMPPLDLGGILERCRAGGIRRVGLVPFTVAAGVSAAAEIAGPGPDSWRTALEQAGIECLPHRRGLGDCDAIVRLWLDRAAVLLDSLA